MKELLVRDTYSNRQQWQLYVPQEMSAWSVSAFYDYLRLGVCDAYREGYLPLPDCPGELESLRIRLLEPESALLEPARLSQQDRLLTENDQIDLRKAVNEVWLVADEKDRTPLDSKKISTLRRHRSALKSYGDLFFDAFDALFDFEKHAIQSRADKRVVSIRELKDVFTQVLDHSEQLRFWVRTAQIVHAAPFENYSKILHGCNLRSGPAMWLNINRGFGGVCAEKTGALQYVADLLGVKSSAVLGSRERLPEGEFEETLFTYIDSGGDAPLPPHILHHVIVIELDDGPILLDATGGNLPLRLLGEGDIERCLSAGMRGHMVYKCDHLQLRRVRRDVSDALLTLAEFHVPDLHMQYIFEQGLGLHIAASEYIGIYADWGGQRAQEQQQHYAKLAQNAGFYYPMFFHENNLCSLINSEIKDLLEATLESVRDHYRYRDSYTGDFTIVVQPLRGHFWKGPFVSESLRGPLASMLESFQSLPTSIPIHKTDMKKDMSFSDDLRRAPTLRREESHVDQ